MSGPGESDVGVGVEVRKDDVRVDLAGCAIGLVGVARVRHLSAYMWVGLKGSKM